MTKRILYNSDFDIITTLIRIGGIERGSEILDDWMGPAHWFHALYAELCVTEGVTGLEMVYHPEIMLLTVTIEGGETKWIALAIKRRLPPDAGTAGSIRAKWLESGEARSCRFNRYKGEGWLCR